MLRKMDSLLEGYASLIVTVADFFGVGRSLLITIWILLSTVTWCLPTDTKWFLQTLPVFLLVGTVMLLPLQFFGAKVLSFFIRVAAEHGLPSPNLFPLRLFAVCVSMVSSLHVVGGIDLWLIVAIKIMTPTLFWLYFLSCGGGSKYKLRDIAKAAAKKVREGFMPNPAPVPSPT